MKLSIFWLVWCEEKGIPTVKHDSEESARNEAERLAFVNPRLRFNILKLVAACKKTEIQWDEV